MNHFVKASDMFKIMLPKFTQARSAGVSMILIAGFGLLAACGDGGGKSPQAGPGGQPPAPRVEVEIVRATSIQSQRELPGRAHPFEEAEIRPQVSGLIAERLFTEGQLIEAGQPLYKVEAAEYAAQVQSAAANLDRAEASAEVARQTEKRFERLAEMNAVSQQELDEVKATRKRAEADIAMHRASLRQAEIDLSRTTISSPIAGQVGRSQVTAGALVTQNQTQFLAKVTKLDPIYLDLAASSVNVLSWKQDTASGRIDALDNETVEVEVIFENGGVYEHTGRLAFSEISVDQNAGSVIIRAVVPNPDGLLLPGMFLKARFAAGQYNDVFLVPQSAVNRTPRGEPYAIVVGEGEIAEQRKLTLAEATGGDWVVSHGLEDGDRLIVDGLLNVRIGAPVTVVSDDDATRAIAETEPAASVN